MFKPHASKADRAARDERWLLFDTGNRRRAQRLQRAIFATERPAQDKNLSHPTFQVFPKIQKCSLADYITMCYSRRMTLGDVHEQLWVQSHRADPLALPLADAHYNRQKPGTPQFMPPGSCCVFLTRCRRALWGTSFPIAKYVKHEWAGAWVCSVFRSEGAGKASVLIRAALAATRAHYGDPPPLGLVTFIDGRYVKPVMQRGVPTVGISWIKAGFRFAGMTKGGLYAFQILPQDMPAPLIALPREFLD